MDAVSLLIGFLAGAVLTGLMLLLRERSRTGLARQLVEQAQAQRIEDLEGIIERLKTSFAALSREALAANSDEFLKLAKTRLEQQTTAGEQSLENKKKLIDAEVKNITGRLTELNTLMQTLDKDRRQSHGSLQKQLETTTRATTQLQQTTAQLREALASPQRRGQWGERMAEDVLHLAGFMEGVNYTKQTRTGEGRRPDFTFTLPRGRRINMDVKFPLDNYLKYLDAVPDDSAEQAKRAFLHDIRGHIKAVTSRDYIDPADGTVDYVLVFIPNEQVYEFIHQYDPTLLDDALRSKVVPCSPLTLYAVLAVIRQASETFRLDKASREILELLGNFAKEWRRFAEAMDKMGQRLEQVQEEYEALSTTRTRKLERQLDKIEDLRTQRGLALPENAAEE